MFKVLSLVVSIAFFSTLTLGQTGNPGGIEKDNFQPEVWKYAPADFTGTVSKSGDYSVSVPVTDIASPSGLSVGINFNYNSAIKYTDAAGWLGLGWHFNPGSVTRSVVGNNSRYPSEFYEKGAETFFLKIAVDFPQYINYNAANSVTDDKTYKWDELRDVYTLTLPNGKRLTAILSEFENGKFPLQNGVGNKFAKYYKNTLSANYHDFINLEGENYRIQAFFNKVSTASMVVNGINIQTYLSGSPVYATQDYFAFVVTDPSGVRYVFARPSIKRNIQVPSSWGLHYQDYINTWRISAIIDKSFAGEIITSQHILQSSYTPPTSLDENMIVYKYDNSYESVHTIPKIDNNDVSDYRVLIYLTSIESFKEKIDFTLIQDQDCDPQHYYHWKSDYLNRYEYLETGFFRISGINKNVNQLLTRNIVLTYDQFAYHSFLTGINLGTGFSAYNFEYNFDWSEEGPNNSPASNINSLYIDPNTNFRFRFNPHRYLNEKGVDNSNYDLDGNYKSDKATYSGFLPSIGQLTRFKDPFGRDVVISYENNVVNLPEYIEGYSFYMPEGNTINKFGKVRIYLSWQNRLRASTFVKSRVSFLSEYSTGDGTVLRKRNYKYLETGAFNGFPSAFTYSDWTTDKQGYKDDTGNNLFAALFTPKDVYKSDSFFGSLNYGSIVERVESTDPTMPEQEKQNKYEYEKKEYFFNIGVMMFEGNVLLPISTFSTPADLGPQAVTWEEKTVKYTATSSNNEVTSVKSDLYSPGWETQYALRIPLKFSVLATQPNEDFLLGLRYSFTYSKLMESKTFVPVARPVTPTKIWALQDLKIFNYEKGELRKEYFWLRDKNTDSSYFQEKLYSYVFDDLATYQPMVDKGMVRFKTKETTNIRRFPFITDPESISYISAFGMMPFYMFFESFLIQNSVATEVGEVKQSYGLFGTVYYLSNQQAKRKIGSPATDDWVNKLTITSYNSFGKPLQVSTDLFNINYYFGSTANPLTQDVLPGRQSKMTGVQVSYTKWEKLSNGTVTTTPFALIYTGTYNNKLQLTEFKENFNSLFNKTYSYNSSSGRLESMSANSKLLLEYAVNYSNISSEASENRFQTKTHFDANTANSLIENIYFDGFGIVQTERGNNTTWIVNEPVFSKTGFKVGSTKAVQYATAQGYRPGFVTGYYQNAMTAATGDLAVAYSAATGYPFASELPVKGESGVVTLKEGKYFRDNAIFSYSTSYYKGNFLYTLNIDEDGKMDYSISNPAGGKLEEGQLSNLITQTATITIDGNNTKKFYSNDFVILSPWSGTLTITSLPAGSNLIIKNLLTGATVINFTNGTTAQTVPLNLAKGVYRFDVSGTAVFTATFPQYDLGTIFSKVQYLFNAANQLEKVIHPDGTVTKYLYDYNGQLIKKETPFHNGKVYNVAKSEDDIIFNPDFQYLYDKYGRIRFQIDPNQSVRGVMTYTKYDELGRMIETGEIASSDNFTQTKADDRFYPWTGQTVQIKNKFDITFPIDGITIENGMNKLGYTEQTITDADGTTKLLKTYYSYNADNQVKKITQYLGSTKIVEENFLEYDYQGRLLRNQILAGNKTQYNWFTYNNLGQLKEMWTSATSTKPAYQTAAFNYDAEGNLIQENLGDGLQMVDYTYNIHNWLQAINNLASPGTDLYAQNLFYYRNAYSGTVPASVPDGFAGNIGYTESKTQSFATVLRQGFNYDLTNRLTSSTSFNSSLVADNLFNTSLTYDVMGNILTHVKKSNLNNVSTTMDNLTYFYRNSRLTNVSETVSSSAFTSDYDAVAPGAESGYIVVKGIDFNFTETLSELTPYPANGYPEGGFTLEYYDATQQGVYKITTFSNSPALKEAKLNTQTVTGGVAYKFVCKSRSTDWSTLPKMRIEWVNAAGTVISSSQISLYAGTSFSQNTLTATSPVSAVKVNVYFNLTKYGTTNSLSIDDLSIEEKTPFAYDNNGNLVRDINRSIKLIEYNDNNLPVRIVKIDNSEIKYGYDQAGRRLWKKNGTVVSYYFRNNDGEILAESATNLSSVKYMTILSPSGKVIGLDRYDSNPGRYYYLKDQLGNNRVTFIDDSEFMPNGTRTPIATLVSSTDYYPFGETLRELLPGSLPSDAKFKYQGKERDLETGYDYFGARMYDAQLGRFLQVDPMAEIYSTTTSYAGMGNNPMEFIDPSGMMLVANHTYYDKAANAPDWTQGSGFTEEKMAEFDEEMDKDFYGYTVTITSTVDDQPWDSQTYTFKPGDPGFDRWRNHETAKALHGPSDNNNSLLDAIHSGLDVAGVFDPFGVADGVNAIIYIGQGDFLNAGISALAIVPLGDIGKIGKYGAKGLNSVTKKVLQSGGHTLNKSTLKALNMTKQEGKIALEALKKDLRIPHDFHGKINSDGDYIHPETGEILGNLKDYLP